MRFGLLSSLVLAVLAVIFALLNSQPMDVDLLFFETEGSTALVLILTFGFGVLVGLISSLPGRLRARRKLKELQRKQSAESTDGPSTSSAPPSSRSDRGGSEDAA